MHDIPHAELAEKWRYDRGPRKQLALVIRCSFDFILSS